MMLANEYVWLGSQNCMSWWRVLLAYICLKNQNIKLKVDYSLTITFFFLPLHTFDNRLRKTVAYLHSGKDPKKVER